MFVVMDQGHYELYGPFATESDAQAWCDLANQHTPLQSDKWEHHIMQVFPPKNNKNTSISSAE